MVKQLAFQWVKYLQLLVAPFSFSQNWSSWKHFERFLVNGQCSQRWHKTFLNRNLSFIPLVHGVKCTVRWTVHYAITTLVSHRFFSLLLNLCFCSFLACLSPFICCLYVWENWIWPSFLSCLKHIIDVKLLKCTCTIVHTKLFLASFFPIVNVELHALSIRYPAIDHLIALFAPFSRWWTILIHSRMRCLRKILSSM